MNPVAWWQARSQAERFDVSFRGSLYLSLLFLPLLIGTSVGAAGRPRAALATGGLTLLHTLMTGLLMHQGTEHYLGRRGRPVRLALVTGAVTVAGAIAAAVVFPGSDQPAGSIILGLLCMYVIGLATLSSPWPALLAIGAGCATLTGLGVARDQPAFAAPAITLLFASAVLFATCRSSLWMLGVVWELDRARTVQAGLAVTEERLRFARDMHDVLGRTLSVIALKSELAAQLARRGRDEAVEEMLEVRRIAQDALTDVRAVVGGYRGADLGDELAGARALLASAGIGCRVIGDGRDLPPHVQGALGWVVWAAATHALTHGDSH